MQLQSSAARKRRKLGQKEAVQVEGIGTIDFIRPQKPKIESSNLPFGSCRPVDSFEKLNRIGEGTYGTVYRARDKITNEIVALKKIILHNEKQDGFPITALREVKLLKRINHPSCVQLLDVAVGKQRDHVFLVFEYCEHDMASLADTMLDGGTGVGFVESEVKQCMLQLLSAVGHLHSHYIIHRDLKMSNLLYNNRGQLKLADFGLAREFSDPQHKPLTPKVVTLWYRAPELLLGQTEYSTAVDMWACGCIFAELLNHKPLIPGSTDLEQLEKIFKLLGVATDQIWPGVSKLPNAKHISMNGWGNKYIYNNLEQVFPSISRHGLNLLNQFLTYDPKLRITASEAMNHPYFREKPLPRDSDVMPTFPTLHTQEGYRGRHRTAKKQ